MANSEPRAKVWKVGVADSDTAGASTFTVCDVPVYPSALMSTVVVPVAPSMPWMKYENAVVPVGRAISIESAPAVTALGDTLTFVPSDERMVIFVPAGAGALRFKKLDWSCRPAPTVNVEGAEIDAEVTTAESLGELTGTKVCAALDAALDTLNVPDVSGRSCHPPATSVVGSLRRRPR